MNPKYNHPRWSQETEKLIGEEVKVVPTKIFNGYGSYVENLYPKMIGNTFINLFNSFLINLLILSASFID